MATPMGVSIGGMGIVSAVRARQSAGRSGPGYRVLRGVPGRSPPEGREYDSRGILRANRARSARVCVREASGLNVRDACESNRSSDRGGIFRDQADRGRGCVPGRGGFGGGPVHPGVDPGVGGGSELGWVSARK